MCSLSWCLSCDIPFHSGETCEEYIASERLATEQHDLEEERERQLSIERRAAEQERERQLMIQRNLEAERERQLSIQRRAAEEEDERQLSLQRRTAEAEAAERARQLLIQRNMAEFERRLSIQRRKAEEKSARQLLAQRRAAEKLLEEFDAARRQRQAELASSAVTRVCPGCRIKIHRAGGCDHMTCKYRRFR